MSDKKKIVDQDLIRELAGLLDETGLTEIEIDHDGTRIRVARSAAPAYQVAVPQTPATPGTAAAGQPPAKPVDDSSHPGVVLSPMVGTAYCAPEPGGRPYVDVGDAVREGQTVLIIEAMKTMNQIPAPRSGTVVKVMVADGQPVEYGEPLMIIE